MTEPINGTGPLARGGSYSDSQAVAAVQAWSERQMVQIFAPQVATALFQTYLTLTTTPLFGGEYKFTVTSLAGGDDVLQGTDLEMQLVIDGGAIVLPGPLQQYGIATGRFSFGGTFVFVFPPGVHTLELQHRQPVSPGTGGMIGANWVLERWA